MISLTPLRIGRRYQLQRVLTSLLYRNNNGMIHRVHTLCRHKLSLKCDKKARRRAYIVIGLVTRHVSGSNGVVAERDDLKSLQYYRFLPIAKKRRLKAQSLVLQTLLTLCKVSFQRFHKLAMGLCFMYSSTLVRAPNKIREKSGLYQGTDAYKSICPITTYPNARTYN